jgi:hypothetical protein
MSKAIHYRETQYGFEYGAAIVTRLCSEPKTGRVTICIETPKHSGHDGLQVSVTKTGKVRIFDKSGEWLKPVKTKGKTE